MKGMLALFIGSAAPWRWHFAEIRNWSSRTLALRQQLTTLQRMTTDLSDFRCSTADPPSSSFPRPRS